MRVLFIMSFVTIALTPAVPVSAQVPRPERPYRGLFAGGQGNAEQSLNAQVSAGTGYDTNVYADQNARLGLPNDPRNASESEFASASGHLSYSLHREKIGISASGGASAQYYFQLNDGLVSTYDGGLGMFWEISSRMQFTANSVLTYQPLSSFAFFPEIIQIEPGDTPSPTSLELGGHFGTTRERYTTFNNGAQLSWSVSRHSSISASFNRMVNDYSASNFDMTNNAVGGRYSHTLAKGIGFHVGYVYNQAEYGGGIGGTIPYTGHAIDAGVDYSRALSISRRTKLSFSTSTGAYADLADTRYLVTGNVHLDREIGRSWNASGGYERGVNYSNQFHAPTISDSFSAGIGGLLSRHVQFHAVGGGSRGQIGLTNGSDYNAYTASSGFGFDLNRSTSLSVDYSYYNYNLGAVGFTPIGVPPKLNRHTLQANVNFWLPIVHRARRPNASR